MTNDRYVRALLTVIAACLVWMSLGGPSLLPALDAQVGGGEVVIVGWRDSRGQVWPLPETRFARRPGQFATQQERDTYDSRVRNGQRLPVLVAD